VHGVDEGVGEDEVRDRLDLRRQLKARAGLSHSHLKAGVCGVAETIDERLLVLRGQLARGSDRAVVKGEGEAVLQEGADHRAGEHASQLLDCVDDAGGNSAEVRRQITGCDAEHRHPDEAHAQAAGDEPGREVPPA